MAFLLSIYSWMVGAVCSVVLTILGIVFVLPLSLLCDGGSRRMMHGVAQFWAKSIIGALPFWNIEVTGLQHVKPGHHYVVVANHQSLLDILVVLAGLPTHFKFVAKKEIFSIPFIGWFMWFAGYLSLQRGSHESGKKIMQQARSWLDRKVGVLFFPEGTRSTSGKMGRFKLGAFKLASEAGVDLLPVVIEGTGDAAPKHSAVFRRATTLKLAVQKPVTAQSMKDENAQDTADRIYHNMKEQLKKLRS